MKNTLPSILVAGVFLALAGAVHAQTTATLTDLTDQYGSPTAPTAGPDDQYQTNLPAGPQNPPGLNYYFDNSLPPGQTFTTGNNADGYLLTSLSVYDAGNSGNLPPTGQAYLLRIYSVSGSNAMLYATYISSNDVAAYDFYWLQWTNLGAPLLPNTQYAYSFGRIPSGSGWANLGNTNNNPYPGGEVALIPPVGGTMTFNTNHDYDACFDVGLTPAGALTVGTPVISPGLAVTNGTAVTVTAEAVGPGPLYYQWQTDGGSGGALTNIPNATGATLAVDTTGLGLGEYRYDVVVSNSTSAATSPVASFSIPQSAGASLVDAGSTISTGPNDVNQFTGGGNGDGLNYYDDNGASHGGYYTGQTFTTGTNAQGYYLTSVAFETGGGGSSGTGTAQPYDLFIYSVSGDTASLLAHYTNASFSFNFGDWLEWDSFPQPLVLHPNSTYAYAFGRSPAGTGWAALSTSPTNNNLYPGGQICLIPAQGGLMTFGQTGNSDAVFDTGLLPVGVGPSPLPFAEPIAISPSAFAVPGTQVTLNETTTNGAPPLHYQWQTDGGTGGTLTNIPASDSTNLVVDTTGWTPGAYQFDVVVNNNYGSSTSKVATLTVVYANANATLTEIGATVPAPLPNDISQLNPASGANKPDGLNYYFDNGVPPGQTFTTGNNPGGYILSTVAISMAGNSGHLPAAGQAYLLRIYTVSGGNATLYATYTSQSNFVIVTDTDWLRWSGFAVPLAPNSTYAYSLHRTVSGWDNLANVSGNPYAGGEVCLIPSGGGAISFGSSHDYDGVFVAGLALSGYPAVSPPAFSPSSTVYAGTPVVLSASVSGAGPFTYQWQTDGGSGTFTNIPGATSATLTVDTTGMDGMTVGYDLVVGNAAGMTTGEVSELTVNPASAPVVVQDITPSAPDPFVGRAVTFSASFAGTLPISYQWQVDKGTGATNIVGQTNTTLTLANLALSDAGSYTLVASNSIASAPSSSATLTVQPLPTEPYASTIVADNPLAYYPLNEPSGSMVAHDVYNAHDGTNAGAAIFGVPGVPNPPFLGFSATNTALQTSTNSAGSWVSAPFGSLGLSNVTFSAWIYPMGTQPNWAGIIMSRGGGASGGLSYNGNQMLTYNWNNNSTWNLKSGLVIPTNQWSFVAMVIEPTQATLYLYNTSGLLSWTNLAPESADVFGNNWRIGNDADGDPGRTFNGEIQDVAIYGHSLSPTQIQQLYSAGASAAVAVQISIQRSGSNVVLSWPQGTLLEATNLAGPWITNTAPSPYQVTPTGGQMFFRVQ